MNEEDVAWIFTARVINEFGDYLVNGNIQVPNDPINTQYKDVQYWDTLPGNNIAPYDPYFGMTVPEAQAVKYQEIDEYSSLLIDEANANPYVGKTTRPDKNKAKVSTRINHSSNGKPKNDTDKDRDDVLADYSDNVMDSNDSASDIVEALSGVTPIMELDVPSMVSWPTRNPPV